MTVKIYDTTLRDGTQAEDFNLQLEDKLKIAQKLDELGVHYIEGGWPGSNPKDIQFFERIRNFHLKNARIAAFGSTHHPRNFNWTYYCSLKFSCYVTPYNFI